MRSLSTAFGVAACLALAVPAHAASAISVEAPWARASIGAGTTSAVYFTLHNKGPSAEILTGAETTVAAMTQLHESKMNGEMMSMEPLSDVTIPAGGEVAFKPGGKHVMLMGLKAPLKAGESFTLTLQFKQAGPQEVTVQVVDPQGPSMPGPMGGAAMPR